jgi:hypothetical protein
MIWGNLCKIEHIPITFLQEVGDSRDSTATRDGVTEGNGALEIKGGRSPCKISKQVGWQLQKVGCGLHCTRGNTENE